MIEEQLNGVEIGAPLQQSTAGFAPQIVHVQIQFRELLPSAREDSGLVCSDRRCVSFTPRAACR